MQKQHRGLRTWGADDADHFDMSEWLMDSGNDGVWEDMLRKSQPSTCTDVALTQPSWARYGQLRQKGYYTWQNTAVLDPDVM